MNNISPFAQIVNNSKSKDEANIFLKIASNNLDNIELLDHIAQLQFHIKSYYDTIETLKKMLNIANTEENILSIRLNLASTYNKTNDPVNALSQLEKMPSNNMSVQMETALSHYFLGEYSKSESIMKNLLCIPNMQDNVKNRIEYNLSIYEMENGDFKTGYYQYIEKGHKIHIWPTQQIPMIPLWKGEVEEGKTIIIHSEGGLGDEIIGVRFMNNIKKLGMKPVWKTNNKDLYSVFNRNGYHCVLDYSEIDTFNAAQVMAMYLPIYLNLDKDSLWESVYLTPSLEYLEKWKNILPAGRKLGIKWQGNNSYDQDLHRSIPQNKLENIEYDGVKINLQLEEEFKNDWSYSPEINSIEDTLAILYLCDDIITSCTSIAHMAGAIGNNVVVCPPIAYYYVWANGIKWYGDHVKIIKQKQHNNWDKVFEQINVK